MNKLKWLILDNLPAIFVILMFTFGMIMAAEHAGGL